jgi:hypothetical protein
MNSSSINALDGGGYDVIERWGVHGRPVGVHGLVAGGVHGRLGVVHGRLAGGVYCTVLWRTPPLSAQELGVELGLGVGLELGL